MKLVSALATASSGMPIFLKKMMIDKETTEIIRNICLAIASIGAVLAALCGIYFSLRRLKIQSDNMLISQQNLDETKQQVVIAQERHLTEAFTKAIDQLGSELWK